jgi:glycogen debranching enzyme
MLRLAGESVSFSLHHTPAHGRAFLRTNARSATRLRREIIDAVESALPRPGDAWIDLPMEPLGEDSWQLTIPLTDPGCFEAKAWFLPEGTEEPLWPEGTGNAILKVQPAWTASGCSLYKAFVRMFRPAPPEPDPAAVAAVDAAGWHAIPPSGTFRALAAMADHVVGQLGFRILLLLPPFPVPTTHARMGRFGSPFAALDFFTVDPACAEHDGRTSPLDQFGELIAAYHARSARVFIDIPINHTGWASQLMQLHPEWFRRGPDGAFVSPGAWGVTWADLVELDYRHRSLWTRMAEVFLFWCRRGVDGFRCDAGYMVPLPVWEYIAAKVRSEFPDTIFLLEGLGGPEAVSLSLITQGGLDWAYSELFQNDGRSAVEWYLPKALAASHSHGLLMHYAETHDNDRLAAVSHTWARMRTALAALTSVNGAWAITCGVEWFAHEKIRVHGAADLNQNAAVSQSEAIARLNHLTGAHPAFAHGAQLSLLPVNGGNVIALRRSVPHRPESTVLVLVNLDPHEPHPASWPAADFSPEGPSLWACGETDLQGCRDGWFQASLGPGAVCCLAATDSVPADPPASLAARQRHAALSLELSAGLPWHAATDDPLIPEIDLGHDAGRTMVRNPDEALRITAAFPFRIDSRPGPTQALPHGERFIAILPPGTHPGSTLTAHLAKGSHSEPLTLSLAAPEAPPGDFPGAATDHIRSQPQLHFLLTNGSGAMSHVRAAWGTIGSQYDALLAANPDPSVPVDRRILFTRCRAWLVRRGISTELTADGCLRAVQLSPSHVRWDFAVPSGHGIRIPVSLTLHLIPHRNHCLLVFHRENDDAGTVQLILRPDIEDRSFHGKTVLSPQNVSAMAAATLAGEHGCHQPVAHGFLSLSANHAQFVPQPESLTVAHPVDAHRGLGPHSDLFSPGYFRAILSHEQDITLNAALSTTPDFPAVPHLPAPTPWSLHAALMQFVVKRDDGHTIIAGYPWFLDWGRDTFIALRGLIAAGETAIAARILLTFARFEQEGTLPNMIRGDDCSNRDTSDAPLWFITACAELITATGTAEFLDAPAGQRTVRAVILSLISHYQSGTPNGIRMDPESGLIFSPSHFTWMDTNHPAGTPREGYPIEIQALWFAALRFASTHLALPEADRLARQVADSIASLYPRPSLGWLADCLHAQPGTPAARAIADDHLRPNQLFAVTLGAVASRETMAAITRACLSLLVPGAIRTLADHAVTFPLRIERDGALLNDPLHPYWPSYQGDEDTRRKPAYHNGTAWPWPLPSLAEALVLAHGSRALPRARTILQSMHALMSSGCLGHLPEITDGSSPHRPGGCGAQAWSVSELLRVQKWLENHTSSDHEAICRSGTASA